MSATLEERLTAEPDPVVEEAKRLSEEEQMQLDINQFKPPQVFAGDFVSYFMDGDDNCPPRPALVWQVKGRTLFLKGMAQDTWSEVVHSVHHASDPMLKYRPQLLKNSGCWDYSPSYKALRAELDKLSENQLMLGRALDRERGTNTVSKITQEARQENLRIQAYCIKNDIVSNRDIKKLSAEELKQKWEAAGSPT